MEKQKIFKTRYVRYLNDNVKNGKIIDNYKSSEFVFDRNEILTFPNIAKPSRLFEYIDEKDDFKSAVAIYEAFNNLNPVQASDERFWVYLAHVDLYPYMKKRWNGEPTEKYIFDHFLYSSVAQQTLMRHGLSGLWWAVHLSKDEKRENKYELTKILFRQLDFPTRTLGTYRLGRHKEAVIGILEFIKNNEDLFKSNFQDKARFLTKYLNQVGGVNNLAYQNQEFFESALSSVHDKIKSI